MKLNFQTILSILLLVVILSATCLAIPDGPYFGQEPPGITPEIFAPGIISLPNRNEEQCIFSPDGNECCFTVDYGSWLDVKIMYTTVEDGNWTEPNIAPFAETGSNAEPSFTPDGQNIFFISNRPPGGPSWNYDIWKTERAEQGWGQPTRLNSPVNSSSSEWYPTTTNDGTLYFSSTRGGGQGGADFYRSIPSDGNYTTIGNLGMPVNTQYNEWCPFISPDESYLIFEADWPTGYGGSDLYISFRQEDKSWTTPRNLGPSINTTATEQCPFVSADGKYLFFARHSDTLDIYWVDARAIFPEYDFIRNGKVDFDDLGVLAACWLTDEPSIDIAPSQEPDGIINFLDFAVFAQHWLETSY